MTEAKMIQILQSLAKPAVVKFSGPIDFKIHTTNSTYVNPTKTCSRDLDNNPITWKRNGELHICEYDEFNRIQYHYYEKNNNNVEEFFYYDSNNHLIEYTRCIGEDIYIQKFMLIKMID